MNHYNPYPHDKLPFTMETVCKIFHSKFMRCNFCLASVIILYALLLNPFMALFILINITSNYCNIEYLLDRVKPDLWLFYVMMSIYVRVYVLKLYLPRCQFMLVYMCSKLYLPSSYWPWWTRISIFWNITRFCEFMWLHGKPMDQTLPTNQWTRHNATLNHTPD